MQNNVTAADLLKLNPLSGAAKPGASLRLACYPAAEDSQTSLRLSPRYFGGEVAYLMLRWLPPGRDAGCGLGFGGRGGLSRVGVGGGEVARARACLCVGGVGVCVCVWGGGGPAGWLLWRAPWGCAPLAAPPLGRASTTWSWPPATLQFAGGNQRPGLRGLAGAMAASGVNDHAPNQNDGDPPYTGSMGGQNGTVRGELVQPVFLFVDLQSQFQVGRWRPAHH